MSREDVEEKVREDFRNWRGKCVEVDTFFIFDGEESHEISGPIKVQVEPDANDEDLINWSSDYITPYWPIKLPSKSKVVQKEFSGKTYDRSSYLDFEEEIDHPDARVKNAVAVWICGPSYSQSGASNEYLVPRCCDCGSEIVEHNDSRCRTSASRSRVVESEATEAPSSARKGRRLLEID